MIYSAPPPSHLFDFFILSLLLSAGSLIWHYYVTMPMPASTFTLAVGHWHQVTAENAPTLERGLRDKAARSNAAKLETGPAELGEADLMSGLGSSSSVAKGSPLKTGRYFIICSFCVPFSSSSSSRLLLTQVWPFNIPPWNFPFTKPVMVQVR